jgi:16S rRNA processing protein RimM
LKDDLDLVRIGRINGPHGLKGFVKVAVISDVDGRFEEGGRVYIGNEDSFNEQTIIHFETHKGRIAIAQFSGIGDLNTAESSSGANIFITREEVENSRELLSDGEFYYYDLVGLSVYHQGVLFGEITEILEGGSGHILRIRGKDAKDYHIPFVDEMVDTSRVAEKRIDITPVEGLI